jgi:uncharacterized protein (TIGR03437 family)
MRFTFVIAAFAAAYAQPLWFEPNGAHFQARHLVLSPTSAVIQAGESPIVLTLHHANPHSRPEALDRLPGVSNYYLGNDPEKWRTDVPHFGRVRYHDVYPGIDVIYYGNAQGNLEYDFIIQPGANPHQVRIAFNQPVHTTSDGDLLVAGLRQRRPKVYQHGREIACDYIVDHEHRVQLALANYDHAEPLTIDPVIEYSTYLGGNAQDVANDIAVDSSGNMYVTGWLESPKYPNLDPFQQTSGTSRFIVIAKMTPSGNALLWYTYVGGTALNDSEKIALDTSGNTYVAGFTSSTDFPIRNAAQPGFGGGYENAVVVKVDRNGKLVYSTYLGGNNQERAQGLAVDSTGAAFVSGFTWSIDFPVKNAIQPRMTGRPDAFLAKLSPAGDRFLFATYLGGRGIEYSAGLALDSSGNPILVGTTTSDDFPVVNPLQPALGSGAETGFITKISSAGDKILYSSYFGGNATVLLRLIKVDSADNIWVFGEVAGPGLPLQNPLQSSFAGGDMDGVIAKLNAKGDSILFSTYFGGSGTDFPSDLDVDAAGNLYASGFTYSPDFPVKNSIQPFVGATHGYKNDTFLVKLSSSGALIYSTLLGGNGPDYNGGVAIGPNGAVYLSGSTASDDFPVKNPLQATYGGGPSDMYIVRLAPEAAPTSPFTITPATLLFRYVAGGSLPPPQTVSVASSSASAFAPTSSASWLKFTASGATTPVTLSVFADPASLQPGVYTGVIQIDPQTSIQVNFTVLAAGPVVTGISPAVIPLGSEATTVTITGSGFQQGATVQLAGGVALATQFIDAGTLQITLDKSSLTQPVTLSFTVVNPLSASSNPITLSIGTPAPVFTAAGVVNAASFAGGPIAPGEIITIFGTNLTSSVTFDGTPATPFFTSPTQVNLTVPYSVTSPATTLQIGASSVQLQVAPSAPGIFAAVPAGDNFLTLYATGCGALTTDDLPRCALPVSATVNDQPATVLYAGIAPGLVRGANQINIQLPDGIAPGQLTIILTAGDAASKPFILALP